VFRWLACDLLRSRWAGAADQVIVVDVDDLDRFVFVEERNWPVGSDHLVVVHGALVVAVMQTSGTDQWVEPAIIHAVHDRLDHHLDVAALSFGHE
jgi:hypothetical protein